MRIGFALGVAVLAAACDQQVTPGSELLGSWGLIGTTGDQWSFADDLTYVRTGSWPETGAFTVDDTRLELRPTDGQEAIAFDFSSTRDHWLAFAQFAVGETSGRAGTYRGFRASLDAGTTRTVTTTLAADGTVHLQHDLTGPEGSITIEGDGTWFDSGTGDNSFTVQARLIEPDGTVNDLDYQLWHLDAAIGTYAYQRIDF